MTQRVTAAAAALTARYWADVEILDNFWKVIFVAFVSPLNGFYRDPVSAGAQILARYLCVGRSVVTEIATSPEIFGAVVDGPQDSPKDIARVIDKGNVGLTLRACSAAFGNARKASADLDKIKIEADKVLYDSLQRERARKNAKSISPVSSSKLGGLITTKPGRSLG